jgi:hypothetical protein
MSNLPIDRNRRFQRHDYPHQPSKYRPLTHFIQRYKEKERFLTDEVINKCIRHVDLRSNNDGCACFRKQWGDGVAYYLIAGFHEDGYRVLVTAWPNLHHRPSALKSDKWTEEELDTIQELNRKHEDKFEYNYPSYNQWLNQQKQTA